MKTVLIIGMNPRTIDYSSPELPKGLTAEQVEQGMRATLDNLDSMGFRAELFLIDTGADPSSGLVHHLAERRYDGIVIGNGIRSIQSNFLLFEKLVNIVHEHAPASRIIFNTLPTTTDEAVKRWLQ